MVVQVLFSTITGSEYGNDGDGVDRLNHKYSAIIFAFLAVLSMSTSLVGAPITCWQPAHFHPVWGQYATAYCWAKNTFIVENEYVETALENDTVTEILYYQWMPLILIAMAFLFYAPQNLWVGALSSAEIDLNKMINTIDNCELVQKPENREKQMEYLSRFLYKYFRSQLSTRRGAGTKLGIRYVIVKFVMFLSCFLQFYILNIFLHYQFAFWGFHEIANIFVDNPMKRNNRFPYIGFCDIEQLGIASNIREHVLQCVLTINFVNEKIFLFAWFWLVIVGITNLTNCVMWALKIFTPGSKILFMQKRISLNRKHAVEITERTRIFNKFVFEFLKPDGVFILRIIDANTTSLNLSELAGGIWELYKKDIDAVPENQEPDQDTKL